MSLRIPPCGIHLDVASILPDQDKAVCIASRHHVHTVPRRLWDTELQSSKTRRSHRAQLTMVVSPCAIQAAIVEHEDGVRATSGHPGDVVFPPRGARRHRFGRAGGSAARAKLVLVIPPAGPKASMVPEEAGMSTNPGGLERVRGLRLSSPASAALPPHSARLALGRGSSRPTPAKQTQEQDCKQQRGCEHPSACSRNHGFHKVSR